MLDASSAAQRWAQSAGQGQQRFTEGVSNTTKDPTALAIANQQALVSNFTQSVVSGRWAANLRAAGKTKWQAMTLAKAGNYAAGIAAGEGNYQAAAAKWFPFMQTVQAQIHGMPSGSLAASQARANAWSTALYNKKRTG